MGNAGVKQLIYAAKAGDAAKVRKGLEKHEIDVNGVRSYYLEICL